jgi:hypothetical protein
LEPDSNVTVESLLQSEKQPEPTRSTDAGMQIDESDQHPKKADVSILES